MTLETLARRRYSLKKLQSLAVQADEMAQRRHRIAVNEIMNSGGNVSMFMWVKPR